jgi:Competence protein CoiA-like family
MRRWAASQGATAKVEAYTPDRRRRSDVAIILPEGGQVAIEVQLGAVSDAEWLARHQDYARAGIANVWLWHAATWIPRVMFDVGRPGWILDLDNDRLGLLHAQPHPAPGASPQGPAAVRCTGHRAPVTSTTRYGCRSDPLG